MSRAKEMRELFARWKDSGQSLMAFGKQEGVTYSRLLYWRRKLEGRDAARGVRAKGIAEPEIVPITVVSNLNSAATTPEKFDVWLANGVVLEVPTGFDEVDLRRLVGVLSSC